MISVTGNEMRDVRQYLLQWENAVLTPIVGWPLAQSAWHQMQWTLTVYFECMSELTKTAVLLLSIHPGWCSMHWCSLSHAQVLESTVSVLPRYLAVHTEPLCQYALFN